jgi:hypothetical protein
MNWILPKKDHYVHQIRKLIFHEAIFVPLLSQGGTKLSGEKPVFIQQLRGLSRFVPLLGQFSIAITKFNKLNNLT